MIEEVPLEKLKIRKNKIRKNIGDLSELMSSMSEIGLLNPLTIDENYCVIEGTRRYYSAKNLSWSKIKCDKRIGLSEYQKITIEIDENLRRKNLNPAEEAKALALKKRAYQKIHPEYRRGGDRKSNVYEETKKNQSANASLRFSQTQAQLYDASERTIKTKTKIGEFILDGKLENKMVDQFGKRKVSQRKILEQIKKVEQEKNIEKIPPEKTDGKKIKDLETLKTERKTKKEETAISPAKEKKEEAEDEVIRCNICRLGVQLTCPVCKEAMVLCGRYKNPSLRRLDSPVCEMFEERY